MRTGDAGERVERASRGFLARPYRSDPLGGGPGTFERLTAGRDAFDCVTFVETALAAAFGEGEDAFLTRLRKIRYRGGRVTWAARNHYMSEWIRENARAGFVRRVRLPGEVERRRVLKAVPGLPPRKVSLRVLPKRLVARAAEKLRTGDVVCFASTRRSLDVFHCGLLVRDGERFLLRHASKSRGRVVEQDLFEFLAANRTAGILVARPVEEP